MEEERMMDEPRPSIDGDAIKASFSDLAGEVATLFRQEVDIARCEIAAAAEDAKAGATKCSLGVGLAVAGALALTAAVILGLTVILVQWMAPLPAALVSAAIVGAVLALAGYLLIRQGSENIKPASFVPRRAIETLKEDLRWAQKKI
jgi:hypothetical protein